MAPVCQVDDAKDPEDDHEAMQSGRIFSVTTRLIFTRFSSIWLKSWKWIYVSPVQPIQVSERRTRGILVILATNKIWLDNNWKLRSVCCGCISDMVLHSLKRKRNGHWATLLQHIHLARFEIFLSQGHIENFWKIDMPKPELNLPDLGKSLFNLQIKHLNWKNAFAFKFSIIFDFFYQKVNF